MEYLYIAMFLQEVGKDINEVNIARIFDALGMEMDNNKVRLLIPALSIMGSNNSKKSNKVSMSPRFKQFDDLEKRFTVLKDSITSIDDRLSGVKQQNDEIKEDAAPAKPAVPAADIKKAADNLPARYVYGIADKGVKKSLGAIGIDGAEVYTIPCRDMCIIVHDCIAEPYQSDDEEMVKNWLFTQQEVLDAVWEEFGVVMPMSFDMIIEGKDGQNPEQEVKDWLEKNYSSFHDKIACLKNRQEFGVQVFLDAEALSIMLTETDEKIRSKRKEIDTKPKGAAYLEKELLKETIKQKTEERADQYFKEFYSMIKKCTDDLVIGKVKKVEGNNQMIMNLSCLVHKDRVAELGAELEKIEKNDCVSVRFSGPWAPYSFVTSEKV